jgi:hypothetical protein
MPRRKLLDPTVQSTF